MKKFVYILILILISCKISNNCDNIDEHDYFIGESFTIYANETLKLKDPREDRVYKLWFSGPVVDNRLTVEECNNITGYPGHGYLYMKLISAQQDTYQIEKKIGNCMFNSVEKSRIQCTSYNFARISEHNIEFQIQDFGPTKSEDSTISFNEYWTTLGTNFKYQE